MKESKKVEVVDTLLEELSEDIVKYGDKTVLAEILKYVPVEVLVHSLSDKGAENLGLEIGSYTEPALYQIYIDDEINSLVKTNLSKEEISEAFYDDELSENGVDFDGRMAIYAEKRGVSFEELDPDGLVI